MKYIKYIFFLPWLIYIPLVGQNLVENGEFENFENCPKSYLSQKHFLPGWYSPTRGTPDYFNKCSKGLASIPANFAGKSDSKNGNGYIGFSVASLAGTLGINNFYSREYVSTKLNLRLNKDTLYQISFLVTHAMYSKISVNRLSIYISKRKVNKAITRELNLVPQVNFDLSIVPKEEWIRLSVVYKASGGEQFLTIGNFQNDCDLIWSKSEIQKFIKSPFDIGAYYYFDDLSLVPFENILIKEMDFTY